jgi:serine protease SohB
MEGMDIRIPFLKSPPRVAVIRLQGMIASGRGGGLNDAGLASVIERAFAKGKPVAVALIVNSPGGSPVQSSLIGARIRRLADEKKIPVHAFCEDVAASGGYWLACAADDIWVDPNSVVGSIGVISAGFGFQDLIARYGVERRVHTAGFGFQDLIAHYGVERRVHTAGTSKSFLDPFKAEKPEDVERLHALLAPIHDSFKAQVRARRGARLADRDLFTGDVWVGQGAVDVGLADGVAHCVPKLKALYGDKVRLVPYGVKRSLFRRLGAQVLEDAAMAVEERALWARYGL